MQRIFVSRLALSVLLGALSAAAFAAWAGPIEERQARLAARYGLEKPEGKGPFPAVMLVPGCSGFEDRLWKGHYERTARRLKESGFVTIRVDYLAAADSRSCEVIMNPSELGDDVATAAKYLRQQSYVKPDGINLLAWSYGGVPAFHALRKTASREPVQVAAAVAYYPHISLPEQLKVETPVLVLCTKQETQSACSRIDTLLAEEPAQGRLKIVKYEDGIHGFDNSDLPAKVETLNGNVIGYLETTATSAWTEVARFLRR
jgi:dienelactone hydrolase